VKLTDGVVVVGLAAPKEIALEVVFGAVVEAAVVV